MITVTSNESNPIRFNASSVTLTCIVRLSPVAQELPERDLTIVWSVPDKHTLTPLSDNLQSTFEHLNTGCVKIDDISTESNNIFQCNDTTYKSIVTVNPFMPGFYNCTTRITTNSQYYGSRELSNGTRITFG